MAFTTNMLDLELAGSTGTGTFVGSTDAVLVTPNIGTPSAGVLTNCTGLPLGSITGLGANVGTWLATPSSANLAAAVTDETGSGSLVFATSPTLVTPVLGTPASGTLTNCTGLPVAGGGTGVATLTAYAVMCGGTTGTGAVQSVSGVGTSGQVLTSNGAAALPTWQASGAGGSGIVQQEEYSEVTSTATVTGSIPQDDTIPQNTEGSEQVTVTITPGDAANILFIEAVFSGACSSPRGVVTALFQDSTADALSATFDACSSPNNSIQSYLAYRMVAGTTSPTTFKIRVSGDGVGTLYRNAKFNGTGIFGGILSTWIRVTEMTP